MSIQYIGLKEQHKSTLWRSISTNPLPKKDSVISVRLADRSILMKCKVSVRKHNVLIQYSNFTIAMISDGETLPLGDFPPIKWWKQEDDVISTDWPTESGFKPGSDD